MKDKWFKLVNAGKFVSLKASKELDPKTLLEALRMSVAKWEIIHALDYNKFFDDGSGITCGLCNFDLEGSFDKCEKCPLLDCNNANSLYSLWQQSRDQETHKKTSLTLLNELRRLFAIEAVKQGKESEPHECWFVWWHIGDGTIDFRCKEHCGKQVSVPVEEVDAMYNAMLCLGLNVSTDFVAALFERQVASMTALSSFDVDRGRFRAAAEAFRKGASK